jgi:hypothetical protein
MIRWEPEFSIIGYLLLSSSFTDVEVKFRLPGNFPEIINLNKYAPSFSRNSSLIKLQSVQGKRSRRKRERGNGKLLAVLASLEEPMHALRSSIKKM